MRVYSRSLSLLLFTAVALVAAQPASAVFINYGNYPGDNVDFISVTEDNDEPTLLFGEPDVSGDALDFDPVGFSSSNDGGGIPTIVDSKLEFVVLARPERVIEALEFSEAGDFTLAGPGGFGTLAAVTAEFFIDVEQVDGLDIAPFRILASMAFTPSGGDFNLAEDRNNPNIPLANGSWEGDLYVDLTAELDARQIDYDLGVTKVTVTLDNTLTTVSEADTSAFIKKKDIDGFVVTSIVPPPVPEPGAMTLLTLGLATLLGFAGRRRR